MNPAERIATSQAREAGLEVLEFRYGKHLKAKLRAPDGREEVHCFPITPSDHRGHLNKLAELRRFARGVNSIRHHER